MIVRAKERLLVRSPFPDAVRKRLVDVYRDDILWLQALLDRDLSAWLR